MKAVLILLAVTISTSSYALQTKCGVVKNSNGTFELQTSAGLISPAFETYYLQASGPGTLQAAEILQSLKEGDRVCLSGEVSQDKDFNYILIPSLRN